MAEYNVKRSPVPAIFPFILIGIGVIWLLAEAKLITAANLSVLWRLWPLVLIGIGLDLLIGRGSRLLGALVAAATVAVVIVLMFVGPSLGLARNVEVKSAHYDEPINGATAASVDVQVSTGDLILKPLAGADALMSADVRYLGTLTYDSSGAAERAISLKNDGSFTGINIFDALTLFSSHDLKWNLGLNPSVPLDLKADNGTGSTQLDLSDFQLRGLDLDSGTGSVTVTLPSDGDRYDGSISAGTGAISLTVPDGAAVELTISTGTGSANIDLPEGAAIKLDARIGTGGVNVPGWLTRITSDSSGLGQKGVWQTDNFARSDRQIIIHFDGGTGSLNVQ